MDERTISAAEGTWHDVDWATYRSLRDDPSNDHFRMDYLDGMLTIRPGAIHTETSELLDLTFRGIAAGCRLAIKGTGAVRLGDRIGPARGFRRSSKERPAPGVPRLPDLVIDTDLRIDPAQTLASLARIGVPEVWRYDPDAHHVRFHRLGPAGYSEVSRSLILPRLTPELVIQALDLAIEIPDDGELLEIVRAWARDLPDPPPADQ